MAHSPELQREYDLIIVGSGGGSMVAALAASHMGKSVVIIEKLDKVGGSTSFSGGVWWIPANPLLAEAGIADNVDQARTYFDAVVADQGPAVTPARRDAFLHAGPKMIDFLRRCGMRLRRPREDWPDYYDEAPGGLAAGRSLMAEPLDLHRLGAWRERLAMYPPMAKLPMGADEFPKLFLMKRTGAGKRKALRFGLLMLRDKLLGRQTVCNGAAIQGRMMLLARDAKVPIFTDTPVTGFVMDGEQVVGVTVVQEGKPVEIRARSGVIVNVGGYSRNKAFRQSVYDGPTSDEWTSANPGDTGEVVQAMIKLGAATDFLDVAWWVLTSRHVDGSWPEGAVWSDGRILPFMHHLDLSLPHLMLVDREGWRFANESGAYMEIGERMYRRHRERGSCFPAWTIFDQRNRDRYPWGSAAPGKTPQQWLDSGYMKKADSLAELAALCEIDPAGLADEVARFNAFCVQGDDEDYGRGSRSFDRAHGDPTVGPNPNLGGIEQGPFYAVAMYPGDVGTAGGVVTDEFARVVKEDGGIISGLYAVGNSAASLFGRCYPGAGASIGSAFTFGYIAAHHALGSNELGEIVGASQP